MFNKRKNTSVISDLENFLKSRNCKYEKQQEDESTVIRFEYQAGHFIATIRKQDDGVDVHYPFCGDFPIGHLDLVRSKCNQFNASNMLLKMTYSINDEKNIVDIHLSFYNNCINPEQMENQLGAVFHFQREWIKEINDDIEISKQRGSHDLESDLHKHEHELYLIRQQELKHQIFDLDVPVEISYGLRNVTMADLLGTIAPLPDARLLFMTVSTEEGQQRIDDADAIRAFDLRHALIEGQTKKGTHARNYNPQTDKYENIVLTEDGPEARFVHDYALLTLHYTQGLDEQPKLLTVAVTAEGEDNHSLYCRLTVTTPPRNASSKISLSTQEDRYPHSTSVLLAMPRHDDKKHYEQFAYMWNDALCKMNRGEKNTLTEDQQLLANVKDANAAYNLYWGQEMFNDGCYFEAILYLQNFFNSYRTSFFKMNDTQKHAMMDIAYKIGFCYNELRLYQQAYYYLDLLATDGNIKHTMELVNTMANNKDMRLFNYTDNVMREVRENFNDDEEVPDHIRQFINFLRRRRAYALIDFGQLDQAEKAFTEMLDEEDNADYAISELAYIKKLRKDRGENIDDDEEITDDETN